MISAAMRRVASAIKFVYPRFELRDSDILLASYPKSGNTWMRFIWVVPPLSVGFQSDDFLTFINMSGFLS